MQENKQLLSKSLRSYLDRYYRPEPEDMVIFYQEELPNMSEDDLINSMEPTFSQMLFRFIKQQGISETDCYKNANLDRRLFSKIRSDNDYQPRKATIFALIIGLKLNINDAKTLLNSAGYTISHSIKLDTIMEFIILKQIYDINLVNEILYSFECPTLGSQV